MTAQTHAFQAEVAQLLKLVTHSLYSNPDIFLREMISNASDACDKLRFEALHQADLFEDAPDLQVRIEVDPQARTLTIIDNGIGLSREEAMAHLGTIAKSGTREFMSRLTGDQKSDAQLIGQFGVGFYSGFIVADRITVESRRAGLNMTQAARGTRVILHLKDDAGDYLQAWKLKGIIAKYSDHISLPILMPEEKWQDGQNDQPGQMVATGQWETVNKASALWSRPKKDITQDQYDEFYKQLSYDHEAPLATTHNRVEGATEYTQLLFIPAKAPTDLYNREKAAGVKLYVKRVFIMDDAEALLPVYLRFVKGVVDSSDLPLYVSREILQESRAVKAIREGNTRRVLSLIEDLAHNEPEKFKTFYREFGAVLKEGLGEDFSNRDRLAKLLRFASSTTDTVSVGLADYKARMKEGQEAIYYITAETQAAAARSPQLEVFRKKGIEVLLMSDRVDEWALSFLHEFDGTPLQSVAKGAVDLGKLQDEEEKKAAEQAEADFKPLLERLKQTLKDKATDVRATTRLVDSPACLVVQDGGMSMQLARMLKAAGQSAPSVKPILEVNASHPLVRKLESADAAFDDYAHILFDQALLAEGGLPEDPAAYVKRVNALLT
jgi:molecular chaperone HtpG